MWEKSIIQAVWLSTNVELLQLYKINVKFYDILAPTPLQQVILTTIYPE